MKRTRMVALAVAAALTAGIAGFAGEAEAWWWKSAPASCVPASGGGGTLDPNSGAASGTVYCSMIDTSAMPKTSAANVTVYFSNATACALTGASRCLHYSWQAGGGCAALTYGAWNCNNAAFTVSPPQSGDFWQNTGGELGYIRTYSGSGSYQLNGFQVTN